MPTTLKVAELFMAALDFCSGADVGAHLLSCAARLRYKPGRAALHLYYVFPYIPILFYFIYGLILFYFYVWVRRQLGICFFLLTDVLVKVR